MKTITIQIGNSDDKLTQFEWSQFVYATIGAIGSERDHGLNIHFHGLSTGDALWQNACWVVEMKLVRFGPLQTKLNHIRKQYRQESIAWTEGETSFIK